LRTIRYSIKTAFKNIWLEKWINLLTILSISIGLSIFSTFIMINLNLESVLKHWSKSFGIIVYMDEKITPDAENGLKAQFNNDSDIIEANYISKDTALVEIRQILGENALVLDVFDENPLPSSFELKLKKELLEPELVTQKVAQIKKLNGVKDVQYGEDWLSSLNNISRAMKTGALFFGCAVFIAVTFMTYSTIKIFFNRRNDDIETLKLLGAPRAFIRLPFLIEGLFIGTTGGMISAISLFGIYTFTSIKVIEFIPSISLAVTSLPIAVYLSVPVAGAFMSIVGSFIAVGKIRY